MPKPIIITLEDLETTVRTLVTMEVELYKGQPQGSMLAATARVVALYRRIQAGELDGGSLHTPKPEYLV